MLLAFSILVFEVFGLWLYFVVFGLHSSTFAVREYKSETPSHGNIVTPPFPREISKRYFEDDENSLLEPWAIFGDYILTRNVNEDHVTIVILSAIRGERARAICNQC